MRRPRPMFPLLLAACLGVPALAQAKITKTHDLRFGTVVLGEGYGTLAMGPDSIPGPVGLYLGTGALRGPAVFHLEGWPPNQPFTVECPARTVIPWRQGSLELDLFKPAIRPLGQALVFDGKGEAHLVLGATLKAGAQTGDGTLPEHMMELKVTCQGESKTVVFHPEGRLMLPLRARETESMDFGRMLAPEAATIVALDPATGLRTVTAGNPGILMDRISRPGVFELSGQPGERVSVQLPDPFKPVLLAGPGESLALSAFTAYPSGDLTLEGGKASVRVGATLTLKAGQSGGVYKGYYTVIFNYP